MQIDTITRTQPDTVATLQIPLLVVVSEALCMPLRHVEPVQQVGRFALVRYDPQGDTDPDVIVCLEASEEGERFNAAVRRFQAARYRGRAFPRWPDWYAAVTDAMAALFAPLVALNPGRPEADFVMEWAAEVRAAGKSI